MESSVLLTVGVFHGWERPLFIHTEETQSLSQESRCMEGAVEAAVTGHLHAGLNISSHSLQSWRDAKRGGMQAFWVETFLGRCMPPVYSILGLPYPV